MTILDTLHVPLPHGKAYDIVIGENLLSNSQTFEQWVSDRDVLIVTNPTIAKLHLAKVEKAIKAKASQVKVVQVIDSEKAKSSKYLEEIYTALIEANYNRKCLIVALGGGVIGDLAGYAAATYQRGVDFIQVPTTLLAQVDSSIGGKTAINHPLGKNLIGAFHQPKHVIIDLEVLKTLETREFSAGLAEVIKYGFVYSQDFFSYLEENIADIRNLKRECLLEIIKQSCHFKAKVVINDEKEAGERALLNFGHTYGHAIEAWAGYDAWLHGEAIATGMLLATYNSYLLTKIKAVKANNEFASKFITSQDNESQKLEKTKVLETLKSLATSLEENPERNISVTKEDFYRLENLIKLAGLPTCIPEDMASDDFLTFMARDKKNEKGSIVLILSRAIGNSYIDKKINVDLILTTIENFEKKTLL